MNPDDRKRRFNEAIVNMLYPSQPQPQPQHQPESEPLIYASDSDVISGSLDECHNASTSGNEECDFETEKLTRAQRKKIRKKRLKEEAITRGKLIGPLLPLTPTQAPHDVPPARSNACEKELVLGDEVAFAKSMKVKNRRMAKRVAKQKQNASSW